MTLQVTRDVLDAIMTAAAKAAPQEACGLLLGEGGRITQARPVANVAADRSRQFEIDPQALIDAHRAARAGGHQVAGYYHSHPTGPAVPSATDRALAAGDGLVWGIAGEGQVRFWRDTPQGFAALSYVVLDG